VRDSDELYTVEINNSIYNPVKNQNNDTNIKQKETENKIEQFQLFPNQTQQKSEDKQREFLRLRDSIFNRNRGPVNNTFVSQAQSLVDEVAEPTHLVPFSCYWPTYDVMSDAQLKWYFYWRSQVRNGEYPHTALSYIFIYIYELINEIGIKNSEDGLIKLCSIWSNYRKQYYNIDKYLSGWIADYISIHFQNGLSDSIIDKINNAEIISLLPDYIVLNMIFEKTGFEYLNISDFLVKYSNYKFKSSKFYNSEHQILFVSYINDVFRYLNNYIKTKTEKGIFDTYKTQKTLKKMPYQNAVYQGKVRLIDDYKNDFLNNKALTVFITAIIKQTENCLRKITEYKGKLKTELSAEYCKVIEKFINAKYNDNIINERTKIEIDRTKIKELIDHSNIIRDKLLSEESSVITETSENIITVPEFIKETDEKFKQKVVFDIPYNDLLHKLTDIQQQILTFVIKKGDSLQLSELSDAFNGVFVQMEIDNINEAAIDCYGDIVIITEGETLVLQEL